MYEKRVKEISEKFDKNSLKKEFYILTHKKHKREIYFQNNKNAINFIKIKFNSINKRILFLLIKIGLLQHFLKKVRLSSELGDVVYFAGQIKSFNLKNKIVNSFATRDKLKKDFITGKRFQKKVSEKGFAPKILEINEDVPYSREELLIEYPGGDDIGVFKKLFSYYKINGVREVTLKKYISSLEKKLDEKNEKNEFIRKVLNSLSSKYSLDTKLKFVMNHGSFAREQVLIKNNSYMFIDWSSVEELIITDLVKFFRGEGDLSRNNHLKKILDLYTSDVKENIILYLVLNEVNSMIKSDRSLHIPRERIRNLIKY